MTRIIICYDVDGDHQAEMKNSLLEKGYVDKLAGVNKVNCNLPETVLSKLGVRASTGLEDVIMSAAKVGAKLGRAVSFEVNNWEAIKGIPHK